MRQVFRRNSLILRGAAGFIVCLLMLAGLTVIGAPSAVAASNGTISGTVTAAAGGAPLNGVSVSVSAVPCCSGGGGTTTASNGTWSVSVPAGAYTVSFTLNGYATQYWQNTTNYSDQTPVTVTSGGTTPNINAALAADGTISGTVTAAAGGAPLGGVTIYVGGYPAAVTAADGTWSVSEPPGFYYVSFALNGYATQYWQNTTNYSDEAPVSVTSGGTTPNINAALAADGTISGTVTAAAGGAPLGGVSVYLGSYPQGCCEPSAVTAANGTWSALEAPGYDYVTFSLNNYATQYWQNTTNSQNAQPVVVTSGGTTPNINAALAADGTISGTVTAAAGGAPLGGVSVNVYPNSCCGVGVLAVTAPNGTWSVSEPAGSYSVSFALDNYATVYYAQPVTVTPGGATPNINAALAADGTISGTVTAAAGGAPLGGVSVQVNPSVCCGAGASTSTAANGTWSVSVPAGAYAVSFSLNDYATQYWENTANPYLATSVEVTAGMTSPNINAALVADGLVSGTVIAAAGGSPLAGVTVSFQDPTTEVFASVDTDTEGNYSSRLPPGKYLVSFQVAGFSTQYWKNTSDEFRPTLLAVSASGTVSNINASLVAPGSISGNVTGPDGTPLPGATVYVKWPGTGLSFTSVLTDSLGNYSVAVPPGSFLVRFSAEGYVDSYYQNSKTAQKAKLVIVAPGQTVSGVDTSLKWSGKGPKVPSVTHVSPSTGPSSGGTTVTVTGQNLAAAEVQFGYVPGSNVVVNKAGTSLTVIAPAESSGPVDVTVTTVAGTSPVVVADTYTYT